VVDREQHRPFRAGQRVRIVACPQGHPDHVGRVGTVAPRHTNAPFRVYVGTGICRPTAVEPVDEDPPRR
jgi:hypothetical protein